MMLRACIAVFLCVIAIPIAHADGWRFARELKLGSRGPDVFALQKVLNKNAATRVADAGAGSPGKETNYFGEGTARAVAAFQRKNAIAKENGFVGALTLSVLNGQIARNTQTSTPSPLGSGFSPLTKGEIQRGLELPTPPHPNARNLEQFLGIVKQVGTEQGRQAGDLESLTNDMRALALATTTNFLARFVSESRANIRTVSFGSSFAHRIAALFQKFTDALLPRADAQIPAFGGMVVYVFPCTCSGNWLVGMVPLSVPPLTLMTHYTGSQAFLNFNAPFTLFMLGQYIPVGAPCLMYAVLACFPLPSQAQTAPMLGTS